MTKKILQFLGSLIPIWAFKVRPFLTNQIYSGAFKKSLKSAGLNFKVNMPVIFHGSKYIEIGDDFDALDGLRIEAYSTFRNQNFTPAIRIGNRVRLGRNVHIGAIGNVTIGDDCLLASNVLLMDHNHGATDTSRLGVPPVLRPLTTRGDIAIGNRVWIGDNVVVLNHVTIGDDVIIGANSVVTKSVPSGCIAMGVPAKFISPH